MSQLFRVTTKNVDTNIIAENRKEVYAKFFLKIKKGEIKLDDVGCIVMVEEDGEEYGFRTVPTLWLMELISPEVAFATLEDMLNLNPNTDKAANILIKSAKQDMWILDLIEKLEEKEEEAHE